MCRYLLCEHIVKILTFHWECNYWINVTKAEFSRDLENVGYCGKLDAVGSHIIIRMTQSKHSI